MTEFHADDADSNANNDASSVQLEIDVGSEIDDGSEISETEAHIETSQKAITDILQCEVSFGGELVTVNWKFSPSSSPSNS